MAAVRTDGVDADVFIATRISITRWDRVLRGQRKLQRSTAGRSITRSSDDMAPAGRSQAHRRSARRGDRRRGGGRGGEHGRRHLVRGQPLAPLAARAYSSSSAAITARRAGRRQRRSHAQLRRKERRRGGVPPVHLSTAATTDRGFSKRATPLSRRGHGHRCVSSATDTSDRAAKYRHIQRRHRRRADRFENNLIVLTHFSRRYSHADIRSGVRRRLPASLHERVRLALPEPFQRL